MYERLLWKTKTTVSLFSSPGSQDLDESPALSLQRDAAFHRRRGGGLNGRRKVLLSVTVTYNDCRVVTRDILLPRPPPPQPSLQTLVESPSSSLPAADYGKCGEESREAEVLPKPVKSVCPRSQIGSSSLIRRLESRARVLVPSSGHLREYIIILKWKHLLLILNSLCSFYTRSGLFFLRLHLRFKDIFVDPKTKCPTCFGYEKTLTTLSL